ncbi:unnamed protein product [Ranitomeya imitator]|uniref:Sulfhydryl oxidase n=1 Tax=Ranitomeya imitator TaxID=111125 RepID=A0ABN9MIU8_9NEOB|nr:unnamed protein product [Ranitomeya imitator]
MPDLLIIRGVGDVSRRDSDVLGERVPEYGGSTGEVLDAVVGRGVEKEVLRGSEVACSFRKRAEKKDEIDRQCEILLFPGRPHVVKLLETLQEWLVSMPLDKIPYDAILDLVNNKMRISGIYLTSHVEWVGCQGSRAQLRGYPCSLWKLFHSLTVQAAVQPDALANTGKMESFLLFGCRFCWEV